MNIDNSIAKALFLSGDAGNAAAAAGWQGVADGIPAKYAGSLFQQLIVQMLAAKGSAKESADEAGGSGAQDMSGETGSDLLAAMLLTEGNLSGISLLYGGSGDNEPGIGQLQTGGSDPASGIGSLETLAALIGGQTEGMQASMMGIPGVVQILNGNWKAFGSKAEPGSEMLTVSAEAAAAGGNDAGIPASLKALFMSGPQTAVPTELGSLQEGTNSQITAQQQAQQAALTGSKFPAFTVYGSDRKTLAAAGTGQTVLTGGDSAAAVPTEIASAQTNPSQAVLNAGSHTVVSGQEGGMPETGSALQTAEPATVKADKMSEESETADYSRITQETQHLHNAGQTGGAAEQDSFIPTVDKAEPYSQIRDEILAKLEQKGPAEFKMQLEPAELGQIDIKLKLSEGKLIIDILAANSKTQSLLTSQVDKLISSMGLQNVQVESVHVSQQMNPQSQDSSQNQSNLMNAAMDFSHRRQQEQFQGEFAGSMDQNGTFGLQQHEMQDDSPAGRIEAFRYGSYRMDYAV